MNTLEAGMADILQSSVLFSGSAQAALVPGDCFPKSSPSPGSLLQRALLDSRQRWQDLVTLAADFAFETDAEGCLAFLWPELLLGWSSTALTGNASSALLDPGSDGFDPFAAGPPYRGRTAWLKRADGSVACMRVSAIPMMDGSVCVGMRGIAVDVTAQHARDAVVASGLRRGQVLDHILRQMRQEVLAPRMMGAVLDELCAALGAAGAVVVNLLASPDQDAVLHYAGQDSSSVLAGLADALQAETPDPVISDVAGHPALTCPSYTRFGERTGLGVWRSHGGTPWTEDDRTLASSATAIIRVVLEHEAIQREMARQARTDPLTGLLNRRSFVEEVNRRIDRLDREQLPGTLMYLDLDHFKCLNDCCGHEAGDAALVQTANMLRNSVRPADIVARLGGDEFALWLDGSDELTAAERAEALRLNAPSILAAGLPPLAPALSTSIGIASRHPLHGETLEDVMRRADQAMYEVKRAGRSHWRVARSPCGF